MEFLVKGVLTREGRFVTGEPAKGFVVIDEGRVCDRHFCKRTESDGGEGVFIGCDFDVEEPAWGEWNGTNPVCTNSNVGIGTAFPM